MVLFVALPSTTVELADAASVSGSSHTSVATRSPFHTPARVTGLVTATIGTAATLGPAERVAASVEVGGLLAADSSVDDASWDTVEASSTLVELASSLRRRDRAAPRSLSAMHWVTEPPRRPAARRRWTPMAESPCSSWSGVVVSAAPSPIGRGAPRRSQQADAVLLGNFWQSCKIRK